MGGRPVLEKVERRKDGERRRSRTEGGELRAPEMPDDRGVDQDVERLGGKSAERGKREPEDLAVEYAERRRGTARSCCEPRAHRSTERLP